MGWTYLSTDNITVQQLRTVMVELIWAVNERLSCLGGTLAGITAKEFKCGDGTTMKAYPTVADFIDFPLLDSVLDEDIDEGTEYFSSEPIRFNMDLLQSSIQTMLSHSPRVSETSDTAWTKSTLEDDIGLGAFPETPTDHMDNVFWNRLIAALDRLKYFVKGAGVAADQHWGWDSCDEYSATIASGPPRNMKPEQEAAWDLMLSGDPTSITDDGLEYVAKVPGASAETLPQFLRNNFVYTADLSAWKPNLVINRMTVTGVWGGYYWWQGTISLNVGGDTISATAGDFDDTTAELDPEDFTPGQSSGGSFGIAWSSFPTDIATLFTEFSQYWLGNASFSPKALNGWVDLSAYLTYG